MNPYSHIVLASKLETLVGPESTPDYYWGAIAPDIRYPAAIQRHQTHISSQRILDFMSRYPHLKSFLQGYLVHCLADEIELGPVFFQHFPFSVVKSRLSRPRLAVMLELYYFEHESVNEKLSDTHNEVLNELGISESLAPKFSQTISEYVTSSSPETRLSDLARLLGLENDKRIDKYMNAAKSFQNNRLLKSILFFGMQKGGISERLISMVASLYRQHSI